MSAPGWYYERQAWRGGARSVAGLDEVGRGCLFGPVVAAAVVLDPERPVRGLRDSKQLDRPRRELLAERIQERAAAWSVAAVDSAQIDRWNILEASRMAMMAALRRLSPECDYWLADAVELPAGEPGRAVVRGDAKCRSIAAASILAKVARDAWIRQWSVLYPEYGLETNVGYGTAVHLAALDRHGPTPMHRMSFRPMAQRCRFPAIVNLLNGVP